MAATARPLPMTYVYRGGVYDLDLRDRQALNAIQIDAGEFHDVIRGTFRIRNHATGNHADFVVTYGSKGRLAAVPIQATYRPRWWLQLELSLDERVDVPPDPAADQTRLQQIQTVCRSQTR